VNQVSDGDAGPTVSSFGDRSSAVGDNRGVIATGDNPTINQRVVHQAPSRQAVSLPYQSTRWMPPLPLGVQDRDESVALQEHLSGGGTAVLTGLGGVGKTQLAADYARWARKQGLDVLVWVNAVTRTAIVGAYATAAADLSGRDYADAEQAAGVFRDFLSSEHQGRSLRWLVVLDDVSDAADLTGLWPPDGDGGRVLVTTRSRDDALLGHRRQFLDVGVFTAAKARAHLTQALAARGRTGVDPADLDGLAGDFGYLPVGLAQAAAFLATPVLWEGQSSSQLPDVAVYRQRLADRRTALAALLPDGKRLSLPDEQKLMVTASLELSIARADSMEPTGLARPMLALAALLDPNGIPETVLTAHAARLFLAAHRTGTAPPDSGTPAPEAIRPRRLRIHRRARVAPAKAPIVAPAEAFEALRALARLNLIGHTTGPAATVRIHQLVQRAATEDVTPVLFGRAAHSAAAALLQIWPNLEPDQGAVQPLRANAEALTRVATAPLMTPNAHAIWFRAGQSLVNSGQAIAACAYYLRLTDITTEHLGLDAPATLAFRNDLAVAYRRAGDLRRAIPLHEAILADRERVLGPDAPDTLTCRNNLAAAYREAGDLGRAIPLHEATLATQERVLGPDAPATLASRHNLAVAYRDAGDLGRAIPLQEATLAARERVLGPDAPDTLTSRNNLATSYQDAGNSRQAIPLHEAILAARERVQGPDAPDTLTSRNNLAIAYQDAGDLERAIRLHETTLAARERVLGPDAPATLTSRHNLAIAYRNAGDLGRAIPLQEATLAARERVLGPDAPDTLGARSYLALAYQAAGDLERAIPLHEAVLADRKRVLGPAAPNTLVAHNNLAISYHAAGDLGRAIPLYEVALAGMERVLGRDAPFTVIVRTNLAAARADRDAPDDSDTGIPPTQK